jgi:hypothetical protein
MLYEAMEPTTLQNTPFTAMHAINQASLEADATPSARNNAAVCVTVHPPSIKGRPKVRVVGVVDRPHASAVRIDGIHHVQRISATSNSNICTRLDRATNRQQHVVR